jgi:hypothetical protein
MKPEDMPTPETDACAKRCRDNLPFALASQNPIESIGDIVTAAHARMLERRLGLAVAALKKADGLFDSFHARRAFEVIRKTIMQIEKST